MEEPEILKTKISKKEWNSLECSALLNLKFSYLQCYFIY